MPFYPVLSSVLASYFANIAEFRAPTITNTLVTYYILHARIKKRIIQTDILNQIIDILTLNYIYSTLNKYMQI